jgi:TRAP transporter TAXI family solute receptor
MVHLHSRLAHMVVTCAVFAMFLCMAAASSFAKDATQNVTIGTGAVTGVYYPAGGAICRLLNRERKEHGIRCFVESTGGSIYNLNALRDGELDFGIVQSDWQYNAFKGQGVFAHGPAMSKLRSVFSLHSEMFTVVARGDSDIRSFDDLKDHRVNVGNPGSGMRAIMDELMDIKGWGKGSFKEVLELRPADQAKALCENKIDAMVFAAGHPNGLIQEVTSMCNARIIPIDGDEVTKLLNAHPYYARTSIPGGMYRGNAVDIPTFGIKATLVTSEDVDEETVYLLTKAVFDNFDSFKTLHFVFATLDKDRMVSAGLTAPLHEGALRYYREVGLMK